MEFLVSLNLIIGNLKRKFDSIKFIYKILLAYIFLSVPFLVYHEKHLPLFVILILVIISLIVSVITFLISLNILKFLFKHEFHVLYETIFIAFSIWVTYLFNFLSNQAGLIFLLFVLGFFIYYRLLRLKVYYQIIVIGITIFLNGLFSFKYLQYSEVLLFNKSLETKYQITEKDFKEWEYDKKTRVLENKILKLKLKLEEDFYFHNPDTLNLKEKTGTGHIAGIISSSSSDPNRYPLIRIFYVEPMVNLESNSMKEEFENILNFEKNQGNMEEIKFLGSHELDLKKWKGQFWTFYDILRPRYSKIGYYIYPLEDGSSIIFNIIENLVEEKYHEAKVESILKSIE